jgi:hypothetical protein
MLCAIESDSGLGTTRFRSSVDLWMMTNPTGRERTRDEWDALLARAGLNIVEVHTKGADTVIEVDVM